MKKSVFLITNKENSGFGTGFVIYRIQEYSYILTCAHVVENTPNSLLLDSTIEAEIVYIGSRIGVDLAVLKAKIKDRVPLNLMDTLCDNFKIIGCRKHRTDNHICEPIDCILDEEIDIKTVNGSISGLKLSIARDDDIVSGYSGSPLICKESGNVVGVVSDKGRSNKNAYSISIDYLSHIWKDLPLELQLKKNKRFVIRVKTSDNFNIFVSYLYFNIEEEKWLFTLLKSIKEILTWRLGKDDDFFEISYLENINLEEIIASSRLSIVLLSNNYLNSRQSMSELQSILTDSTKDVMVLEYNKITIPKMIEKKKTFRFWYQDIEGISHTYNPSSRENLKNNQGYFDLVEDIATTIQRSLDSTFFLETNDKNAKVFLAKTTDDLEFYRSEIGRYLEDLNYDVYPKKIYPQDRGYEFKEAVERDLQECNLFIQLLSEYSREAPIDLKEGYSKAQFDIAKKLKIPILQWSEAIDLKSVTNETQKELLSTEFIRIVPIEEFKRTIENHFIKFKEKESTNRQKIEHEDYIFINFSSREKLDKDIAIDIDDSLSVEDQNQTVNRMPIDMKASKLSDYIDSNLEICDYYILVYGDVDISWINDQFIQFKKIKAKVEDKKNVSTIIYNALPFEREKVPIKSSYLKIINYDNEKSINNIQKFISKRRDS